ncbi:MAG: hypothetical protein JWO05_1332 [Gemmatimonadetes bacterium]|nr:hypothetical protein [Gemmatimonadota bacterium]
MTEARRAVDVTVIVAVRNGEASIVACVESLLALRSSREVEIIVVDNDSTDGTRRRLESYADRLVLLSETERGVSAARNCGIRAARGEWVAFTDADCVVDPGWLDALLEPLVRPEVGIVGGRIAARHGANAIERFGEEIHDHKRAIEDDSNPYVISMSWASRRSVLIEAGLFDLAMLRGQDVDLAWRIHELGYQLVYAPNAVLQHGNERTLLGLVREGYLHGRWGHRVRHRHRARGRAVRRWMNVPRLVAGDLRRLVLGPSRVAGFLCLCFDLGKALGELSDRVRARVRES